MTVLIYFHQSHYRHFKGFYLEHVHKHLRGAFPRLLSYTRFVALMPSVLVPLSVYLRTRRRGELSGISFIDSTLLIVCHNRRIRSQCRPASEAAFMTAILFKHATRGFAKLGRVHIWQPRVIYPKGSPDGRDRSCPVVTAVRGLSPTSAAALRSEPTPHKPIKGGLSWR
jgi:hypothetical protein